MAWHLLHPIAVHAPIAFLGLGFVLFWAEQSGRAPAWAAESSRRLLWLGSACAWAALGLGLLAEKTAPHVPSAWEVLEEHEALGYWTCGVFTALSVLTYVSARRELGTPGVWARRLGWALGAVLLASTAYHGGELVYRHGMGVLGLE